MFLFVHGGVYSSPLVGITRYITSSACSGECSTVAAAELVLLVDRQAWSCVLARIAAFFCPRSHPETVWENPLIG